MADLLSSGLMAEVNEFWCLCLNYDKDQQENDKYSDYILAGWEYHDIPDNERRSIYIPKLNCLHSCQQFFAGVDYLKDMISEAFFYSLAYYTSRCYMQIPTVDCDKQSTGQHLKFPLNIKSILSMVADEGRNDTTDWSMIGLLNDNKYFFYTAWCDFSGFTYEGGTRLYICTDYNLLITHAMTKKEKVLLDVALLTRKRRLARMVYCKFVELLSKPPFGYYFLLDMETHLFHNINNDNKRNYKRVCEQVCELNHELDYERDHEQFRIWRKERNYEQISKYLKLNE